MSDEMFAVAIIILVACIIYYFINKRNRCENSENYDNEEIYDDNYEYLDDITQDKPSKQIYKVHPYFVEMQFHNDYRDVITAFDCIVETGRPLFNRSNQPVKAVNVKKTEAKNLLRAFVKTLNKNIKRCKTIK